MPHYWLTTHYPHPADQSIDWNIYLHRDKRGPSREPQARDQVFFFELKTAKQVIGGSHISEGERQIVALATVRSPFQERPPGKAKVQYTDNTSADWAWEAMCVEHDYTGRVRYEDVNRILGFSRNFNFLGFADGSGLKQITTEQFESLRTIFLCNRRS